MKILVAVDSSASFTGDERWEHLKKIVNDTVNALSNDNEVQVAKVGYLDLRLCDLETFNAGWDYENGDGGGLSEYLLNGLDYDKVLFITDGFVDLTAFDNNVSVMILEDPDYVENPQVVVGFLCNNCGKEKGLHQANKNFCPVKKGYFSTTDKYTPDTAKPVRKLSI